MTKRSSGRKEIEWKEYLAETKELINGIGEFEIQVIPREANQEEDALTKYVVGASLVKEVHCLEGSGEDLVLTPPNGA